MENKINSDTQLPPEQRNPAPTFETVSAETLSSQSASTLSKQNSLKVFTAFLVVALLIVGGVATYFWQRTQALESMTPTPVVTSQLSPSTVVTNSSLPIVSPLASDIANWQTYNDTKNNYIIKYPSDWTMERACLGGKQGEDYPCLMSSDLTLNAVPSVDKGQLITIGIENSSAFPAFSDPTLFCKNNDPTEKIESCTPIKIGSVSAIKKVFTNSYVEVGIIKDSKIILLFNLMYNLNQYNPTTVPATFDQIVSTFQFTN